MMPGSTRSYQKASPCAQEPRCCEVELLRKCFVDRSMWANLCVISTTGNAEKGSANRRSQHAYSPARDRYISIYRHLGCSKSSTCHTPCSKISKYLDSFAREANRRAGALSVVWCIWVFGAWYQYLSTTKHQDFLINTPICQYIALLVAPRPLTVILHAPRPPICQYIALLVAPRPAKSKSKM